MSSKFRERKNGESLTVTKSIARSNYENICNAFKLSSNTLSVYRKHSHICINTISIPPPPSCVQQHNMSALSLSSIFGEREEKKCSTTSNVFAMYTFSIHSFQFTKELGTSSIKIQSEIQQRENKI